MGEGLARLLIKQGWSVVAIARRLDRLTTLQNELGKDSFYPFYCDVTKPKEIWQVTQTLKKKGLIPRLFFLNAGSGWKEDLGNPSVDFHREIFNVNYFGALSWIEQWLPEVKDRETIFVGISSITTLFPTLGSASYCASKAALKACFHSLSLQYDSSPVRFVTVLPGPINTALLKTDKDLPFSWAPDKAAHYILKKVFAKKEVIAFPFIWVIFFQLLSLIPKSLAAKVLK